jgi:thiol-disulfide isomerase/thioredoxin
VAGRELNPEARMVYVRADGCAVCVDRMPVARAVAAEAGLPLSVLDLGVVDDRRHAEALRIDRIPTLALSIGERVPFRLVGRMITPENVAHLLRATLG